MAPRCRFVTACALAAAPVLAAAQTVSLPGARATPIAAALSAPLKSDGAFRYALGAGGSYAAGWTGTQTSANVGGEGIIATSDSRLRFGAKALWSRIAGETTSAETRTVLLTEESQHRWRGNTWFRQKLSLFPALRSGENAHGIVEAGVAMAMSPFCSLTVGLAQPYDAGLGFKADPLVSTAISFKLR